MVWIAERWEQIQKAVNRDRLIETARQLIAVPSPTGSAGEVSDLLTEMLRNEGFAVDRLAAGHSRAPAVVARWESGRPGPTLQFNGHLDTVHLPFVPPKIVGPNITGSGAADMKGGIAAMIEALRVLRETEMLERGSILLTAHDLHEAPWGFGEQLDAMIRAGVHGDAVLIPEPLTDYLPRIGRGSATWRIELKRSGAPVHEVMRPEEPDVISAGAALVQRLHQLDRELASQTHFEAGRASVFIGQIHAGEIYNQYPQICWMEGTRRWLPQSNVRDVESDFRRVVGQVAAENGVGCEIRFQLIRDAFWLDEQHPVVGAFRRSFEIASGRPIPWGAKPFVDDGNSFCRLAGVAAITHGPRAGGQHTIHEWVSIDDMVRVAAVYAVTAIEFCSANP
jgi:acetylornithine deacetylase/succinyl-diaminopimelate desuccinylase-like protein